MLKLLKNDIFKVLVYVAAVIVTGASLAPVFYDWGKTAVEEARFEGKPIPVLKVDLHAELKRASLPRYWNRAMQLSALVYLLPLMAWLNVPAREILQLRRNPRRFRDFGFGFAIAALWMAAVGLALLKFDVFALQESRPPLGKILHQWLLTALVVAVLEEFFFRGCLMGLTMRKTRRIGVLLFVSTFFAAVHFLKPPEQYTITVPRDIVAKRESGGNEIAISRGSQLLLHNPFDDLRIDLLDGDKTHRILLDEADRGITGIDGVKRDTGFWLLGRIFAKFRDPRFIVAEFATLFLIGWILGYTRLKTRSLWLAIGLHAGWIFAYESFRTMTAKVMTGTQPWIGDDLKSGLLAIWIVTLTGVLTWMWLKATER